MPPSQRNRNIGRGNACPQCRARKLRCDGVRPICGPCVATRRKSIKMIAKKDTDLDALISSSCYDEHTDAIQQDHSEHVQKNKRSKHASPSSSDIDGSKQTNITNDLHIHLPGLPPLDKIRQCIQVCFEEFRLALIFQPKKLMERLKLPSDHRDFPHRSVLHVFVGLAYAARPQLSSSSEEAHRQHCAAAHEYIRSATQEGLINNPLDTVRASLLLVMKLYGQGDLLQSYVACAEAIRLCLILNLHQDPASREEENSAEIFFPLKPFIANRSFVRLNSQDCVEQEEARRTMLLAFRMDRMCTIVTLWPTNLNEREYKADLPHFSLSKFLSLSSTTPAIEESTSFGSPTNTFKLQNSDLLDVATGDLEQFLWKGGLVLGRCAEHSASLPEHSRADEIKSTGSFIQMETSIALLQLGIHQMNDLNISPFQVNPAQKVIVGQSLSSILSSQSLTKSGKGMISVAHMLPHACNLMLHDPLSDLSQESRETCNAAVREIIRILRLIALHAAEEIFCQLDITLIISITITGQSLIRELQRLYLEDINNYFIVDSNSILDSIKNTTNTTIDQNNDQGGVGNFGYIRGYLDITLLSLRQIGKKWKIASQLHDRLLRMLEFRKDDQRQGMIFSGYHREA